MSREESRDARSDYAMRVSIYACLLSAQAMPLRRPTMPRRLFERAACRYA